MVRLKTEGKTENELIIALCAFAVTFTIPYWLADSDQYKSFF
jgi:hypothetical protein